MRLAAALCVFFPLFAAAASSPITVVTGETTIVPVAGATAAWTLAPSIADASVAQGMVTVHGKAPGTTKVVMLDASGQRMLDVTVTARPGSILSAVRPRADRATAEVRYSSATREIQNSVTVSREERQRRTEVEVRTVHQAGGAQRERAATSVAAASVRFFRRNRELTLLDRDVDHSPLTLSATPLRGIHYVDEHWRLHAGATAYTTYRSFLLPVERRLVAGGGYAFRTGPRSTLTPTLFAYRGEGTVATLLYEFDDAETLRVRGEVGFSDGIGAAAEIAWDGERDRAFANLRYRPESFAVPSATTPRGFLGDASWTHEYGRHSSATASWSMTDTAGMKVSSVTADVDHRVSRRLSVIGGASWATFGDARTITIPAGARIDFANGSAGAIYRHTRSASNEGGHGVRLYARASRNAFSVSAYGDYQRNAPTLDVIFAERPDLALALAELGIAATTPADVARALREHAVLAELGFVEGVTLELAPVRTQLGLDAAWMGRTSARHQLRARLLHSSTETVARRTTNTIASLSYSRALASATDVFASWTYWRTEVSGESPRVQPFVEVGVRQRIDGDFLGGSGSIHGVVFADENLDGRSDGSGVAAELELDGARTTRTRADGSFTFTDVPRGPHRVVARVPERQDAYFTTPSRVEAESGDRLAFGVAFQPGRLLVRVIDDTGQGLAGVRVLLTRGSNQITATSESDGDTTLTAPPGEWEMSIARDSVSAGYAVTDVAPRTVVLDPSQPLRVDQVVRAMRTISGKAAPLAEIDVQPLNRRIQADAQGRYALRSLPAGELVIAAAGVTRKVDVPRAPTTMTVDLDAATPVAPRTEVHGERRAVLGDYVVQIGAFRIHENAVAAAARARAIGVRVVIEPSGSLTIVRSEPVESREAATGLARELERAGIEAIVIRK